VHLLLYCNFHQLRYLDLLHFFWIFFTSFWFTRSMEGSSLRDRVDEELVLKTGKAAGFGLAAGSVWGGLVSMLRDGPQVGSNVKYPELVRTGMVCGHYAGHLAALGATYVCVEQSLEKYRKKKDYLNGAVAGFAAGATVLGFRGNYQIVMRGLKFLTQLSMDILLDRFSCFP
jgi:import inner membrane translocase subunit TIM22